MFHFHKKIEKSMSILDKKKIVLKIEITFILILIIVKNIARFILIEKKRKS